jgi:hypothetical protein
MGLLDLAAEVVGALEAHALLGVAPMSPTLRHVVFEVRQAVTDGLGPDRMDELLRVGAGRPVVETVDRTRKALLGQPISG